MALPALENWDKTRVGLRQIAQVLGAIRAGCSDPQPNDLHFSLSVSAKGVSTTRLRCGGDLRFDFDALRLTFVRESCSVFTLDVKGHSQISLMDRLLAVLGDCGSINGPSMKRITGEAPFEIERAQAACYWQALAAVFAALAGFRDRLQGHRTPLALWPHHFDLGFVWFPTAQTDERSAPQIAYGFAPSSPGLDRPYIYAYAWSRRQGYLRLPAEAPAKAITEGYTGLYASYDDLRAAHDFDDLVSRVLMRYHQRAAAKLHIEDAES